MPALEPVIATLLANTDEFTASLEAAKAQMDEFAASADASGIEAAGAMDGMGVAASDAGRDVKDASEDAAGSLGNIGTAAKDSKSDVEDAAEDIGGSLGGIGGKADKAAGDVERAGKDMEGSSSRASGVFHKLGNVLGSVNLPFSEASHKIGDSLEDVERKGSGSFASLAHAGKLAAIGIGVGFAAVAAGSLDLADKFEPVQAALKTSIDATGSSFTRLSPQINDVQNKFASLGFNMTDTDGAMQTLITSTGSAKQGMSEMGLAANIARLNNISLGSAATMVAKANAGSARIMTQWGINANIAGGKAHAVQTATEGLATAQLGLKNVQKEVADGAIPATEAQEELASAHNTVRLAVLKHKQAEEAIGQILSTVSGRVKDAAKNYGETLSGKMHEAGAEVENLGTKFGLVLIPALLDAINAAGKFVGWLEQHKPVLIAIAAIVGTVLVAALAAYVGGLIATAAAELAALSPIILIVAAIALLAAGIYELYKHWNTVWTFIKKIAADAWHFLYDNVFKPLIDFFTNTFTDTINTIKKLWDTVWGLIKSIVSDAVNFVKSHIDLIIGIITGPFGFAIAYIATHWSQVWGIVKLVALDAWHFLDNDVFHPIASFFNTVWDGALHGAEDVWDSVWGAIKSAIQDAWNFIEPIISAITGGLSSIGSAIGHVTGLISGIGHIGGAIGGFLSHLAGGGLVTKPTIAMIGEAGPELVLNQQQTQMAMSGGGISHPSVGGNAGGGGNITNIVNISGAGLDEQQLANLVRVQLLQLARSTGTAYGRFGGTNPGGIFG